MSTSSIPLKRCARNEQCVHPEGPCLPRTPEYFTRDRSFNDGLYHTCKACRAAQYRAKHPLKSKPTVKRCPKCGFECDLLEAVIYFSRDRYHKDGLQSRCKKCQNKQPNRAEQQRRSNAKHRDDIRIRRKAYRRTERGRAVRNADNHRRRAKHLGVETHYSADDVQLQIKAQTDKRGVLHCWWCGKAITNGKYHIDHAIPLTRGGTNSANNIRISHPHCNLKKNTKLPSEFGGQLF